MLDVGPQRARWPILQRIVMEDGRPPLATAKISILVVVFTLQIGVYLYMITTYSVDAVNIPVEEEDLRNLY